MQEDAIQFKNPAQDRKTNFYRHYEIKCEYDSAEKFFSAVRKTSEGDCNIEVMKTIIEVRHISYQGP